VAMLPHEKELVERLKNEPFALIGVNSDTPPNLDDLPEAQRLEATRVHVKKKLDDESITWRNAIDVGTEGPWASRWNVSGWPTLYVLDRDGKIHYKGHSGDEMTEKIEALLAAK
jgi:hypothetical protein